MNSNSIEMCRGAEGTREYYSIQLPTVARVTARLGIAKLSKIVS